MSHRRTRSDSLYITRGVSALGASALIAYLLAGQAFADGTGKKLHPPVAHKTDAASHAGANKAEATLFTPVAAGPIELQLDFGKLLDLPRPAASIIIGNPAIADATIIHSRRLLLTARSFGSTNLIIFDAAGNQILDRVVQVGPADQGYVNVYQGSDVQVIHCAPKCRNTPGQTSSGTAVARTSLSGSGSGGGGTTPNPGFDAAPNQSVSPQVTP